MTSPFSRGCRKYETKKADVAEHREVFNHVGLLFNEPPGTGRAALYIVIRERSNLGPLHVIIRRGASECNRIFGSRLAFYARPGVWSVADSKGNMLDGARA